MTETLNSQKVVAVIVGIEKYELGQTANLDGPANDAVRFAKWLLKRNVPPENIFLFLSPLDGKDPFLDDPNNLHQLRTDNPLVEKLKMSCQAASENLINEAIAKKLSKSKAELLYFFWSGHGVMGSDQKRYLILADAWKDNKRVFELDNILLRLRSNTNIKRQIGIIDACANYFKEMNSASDRAPVLFSTDTVRAEVKQYILYAAAAGERAKNDEINKTGEFFKRIYELLQKEDEKNFADILANTQHMLPDIEALKNDISRIFEQLKREGQINQTPVCFQWRDWNGSEWQDWNGSDKRLYRPTRLQQLLRELSRAWRELRRHPRQVLINFVRGEGSNRRQRNMLLVGSEMMIVGCGTFYICIQILSLLGAQKPLMLNLVCIALSAYLISCYVLRGFLLNRSIIGFLTRGRILQKVGLEFANWLPIIGLLAFLFVSDCWFCQVFPSQCASPLMIFIPAGDFKRGSSEQPSEEPPGQIVSVPSFYIGKYEVTQAQWKAVMGDTLKPAFQGDNLPMDNVSWDDAKEFCKQLSKITGKTYRLPSEAEWEYACRMAVPENYAERLKEIAWYENNSESKTHPVGEKKCNTSKPCDMLGNVMEWCEDFWHENYKGAPRNGSAWTVSEVSDHHVIRGASYLDVHSNCRPTIRGPGVPDRRHSFYGVRVVRDK